MPPLWHVNIRTNYVVWCFTFAALFAVTGFYRIYPDQPLWLAWLFSPLILFQGLANMDGQSFGHIGLLVAIMAGLVGSSWMLQCMIMLLWNRRRRDDV